MSAITEETIPGYVAGTWTIDPVHSEIGFSVRHMMVSKVRGEFNSFSGDIVTGVSPLDSRASATIDLSSIVLATLIGTITFARRTFSKWTVTRR